VMQQFHLNRRTITDICQLLQDDLEGDLQRAHCLPVALRGPAALAVYATVGYSAGISQLAVSCVVRDVTSALVKRAREFIHFTVSHELQQNTKQAFLGSFVKDGFSGVLGAIDCTHVQLHAPTQNRHLYINHKGTYSVNMQVVCDLLPNRGTFKCAHTVTEETFAILEMQFRCLDVSGGTLQYTPQKVSNIILAGYVLHNIALRNGCDVERTEERLKGLREQMLNLKPQWWRLEMLQAPGRSDLLITFLLNFIVLLERVGHPHHLGCWTFLISLRFCFLCSFFWLLNALRSLSQTHKCS
ncbi:HARB1 nuclease, partial [Polyodon spathula]|nr:HARB1 nuclease [Polyodon spathula]